MQNSDYVDDNLFQGIYNDIDRVAKATREKLTSRGVSPDSEEWKTVLTGVEDYVRDSRRNILKREALDAGKPDDFANYRASAYMNGQPIMRFSEYAKNKRNGFAAELSDFFGRSYLAVEGFLSGMVGGTASKIAYAYDHDPAVDAGPIDFGNAQAIKDGNLQIQGTRDRLKKHLAQAKASGKDSLDYGGTVYKSDADIDAAHPLMQADAGLASRLQSSANKGVRSYDVGQDWKNWAKSGIRMSSASMQQNPLTGLGAIGAMTLENPLNAQDDRLVSDVLVDTSGVGGFLGTVAGTTLVSSPAMFFPPALAAFLPVGYQGGQERAMENWRKKAERARALGLPEPAKPTADELNRAGNIAALSETASEGVGNAFEMAILLGKGARAGNAVNRGAKSVADHGADATARITKNALDSLSSEAGSRGAIGALKSVGQVAKVGGVEALEEVANEVAVWEFVDGMQGEREISTLFRNAAEAGIVGFAAGAGTAIGVKGAQRVARRSEDKAIEAGAGPGMLTRVIEGISDRYALQRLNAMSAPAIGSRMANQQVATFTGGGRTAVIVDARHRDVTLTDDVKNSMTAAGIDVDAPIRQGNLLYYTSSALAPMVQNSIRTGDTVGITGVPRMVGQDDVVVGAAVIRDQSGQPVEVIPYGANVAMEQVQAFAAMQASAQPGLTFDIVEGSQAARISDLISSQVDADRATMGLKQRKSMRATSADVKTAVSNLKIAIAQRLHESMGSDPNVDVKVVLRPVARKYYSEGERQIADAGVPATILDGYVDVTTIGENGKKSTERMPIPMDGAYHHQMSEDGVFLIRENGDAMTFRSAFVTAVHEGGHRMVQRSRGGALWMNMLVNLDPAFALRSGAAYMRKIDNSAAGMTDAEIINDMIARYEAAQSVLGRAESTAAQRDEATKQMQVVERFAEESAAETLTETSGLALGLASQYDRTYRYADNMSTMKFATWLANVLVRNGFAGKHARAVLDMFSQRINNVREASVRMDAAYRKNARKRYQQNLAAGMESEQRIRQGEQATPAAPVAGTPSASMRAPAASGQAVAAATPPDDEKRQGASLAEMATGMIPSVSAAVPLLTQAMAQIAPTRGASVRAPQATREQVEQRAEPEPAPGTAAAAAAPVSASRIVEPEPETVEPEVPATQVPEVRFSGRRSLRGEWWLTESGPLFADGDVGNANHEILAQEQAVRDFTADLVRMANESNDQAFKDRVYKFDDEISRLTDEEGMDLDSAQRLVRESFKDNIEELSQSVPETDRPMFKASADAAMGKIDARDYGLQKGWARVQGNNIQMQRVTDSSLRRVADNLSEAEDPDVLSEQTFTIEDMTARRTYDDVPFAELDKGSLSALIPFRGARFSMRRPSGTVMNPGEALDQILSSPFDTAFSARTPKKRNPIARGKKAMIARIQQEYSRRDMPLEDVRFATDLLDTIGGVDTTAIRFLGPKMMRRETGGDRAIAGLYSFVSDMVTVATDAVKSGDFRKTFAHEYWHRLTQYLEDAEVEQADNDFIKARDKFKRRHEIDPEDYMRGGSRRAEFLKAVEEKNVDRDEWYRLVNLDEWIAENMSDPTLERVQLGESSKNIIGLGRLMLRNAMTSIKNVFGKGRYDAIARQFLEGTRTSSMPGMEPDIQARRRIGAIRMESRDREGIRREEIRGQAQAGAQAPIEAMFSRRRKDAAEPRFRNNPYKSQIRALTTRIVNDTASGTTIPGVKGKEMTRDNWIAWAQQNGLPKSQLRWLLPWMFGNPLGIQRITLPTSHKDKDKLTPLQFAAELESAIGITLTPMDLGDEYSDWRADVFKANSEDYREVGMVVDFGDEMYPRVNLERWYGPEIADAILSPESMEMRSIAKERLNPQYSEPHFYAKSPNVFAHYRGAFPVSPEMGGDFIVEEIQSTFHRDVNEGILFPGDTETVRERLEKFSVFTPDSELRTKIGAGQYGVRAAIEDVHRQVRNTTFIDAIEDMSPAQARLVEKAHIEIGAKWAPNYSGSNFTDNRSEAEVYQRIYAIQQNHGYDSGDLEELKNPVRRAGVLNAALDTARNTVDELVSVLRDNPAFEISSEQDIISTIAERMPYGVNTASAVRRGNTYRLADKARGVSTVGDERSLVVQTYDNADFVRAVDAIGGLVTRAAGTSGLRSITNRAGLQRKARLRQYANHEYLSMRRRVNGLIESMEKNGFLKNMNEDMFFSVLLDQGVDPFIFEAIDRVMRAEGLIPVDAPPNRTLVKDWLVRNLHNDAPFAIYADIVSQVFDPAFNRVDPHTQLTADQAAELDEFSGLMTIALGERLMAGMISDLRFVVMDGAIGNKFTALQFSLDRTNGGGQPIHVSEKNLARQMQSGDEESPDALQFGPNFLDAITSISQVASRVHDQYPEIDQAHEGQTTVNGGIWNNTTHSVSLVLNKFGYSNYKTPPGPLVTDLRETDAKVVNDWIDPVFQAIVNEVKARVGTPQVGHKIVFTRSFETPQKSRMPAHLSTKKYGWTVEDDVSDMEALDVAEDDLDRKFISNFSIQMQKDRREGNPRKETKGVYRERLEAFTKKFGGQLIYETYGNLPHKRMQLVFDQKLVDSVKAQFPLFSMRRGAAGAWDRYMVNFIDRHQALRLYADQQRRRNGNLPDANNPYLGLRLLPGRLSARMQRLNRRYRGILRQMFDAGVDLDMMDQFLTAQHARERNENIAARNPAMPDGGSGMTTADADILLNGHRASGTFDLLDNLAGQWRAMLNSALAERYMSGMMTTDDYQRLSVTYRNYVPLRGRPADPFEEDFEGGQAFGAGMSASGVGMPRAYGRESRAENVTSQVAFVVEDTIRRAERNRVANRFLRMVLDINDVGFAEVVYPTTRLDVNGVTQTVFDRNWPNDPRHFGLYAENDMVINGRNYARGELVIVRLNNGNLQKSLGRGLDMSLLRSVMNTPNNLLREMTTGLLAPFWMLRNLARDFSTGIKRNYANYGVRDATMAMARWPLAFGRVMADEWINREPTGSYARYVDNGGSMAPYGPNDLEMQAEAFDRMYEEVQRVDPNAQISARRVFSRDFILGAYRAAFTASETASRLAIFNQRLSRGDTVENAVLAGRDVTVDFARGGYYKPFFNTVWLYWNASMQGSANTLSAIRRSPSLGISLVGIGFMTALMNRLNAGDDEKTEMNRWDQVSKIDKANKLYMFSPDKSGKAISVPQSYGFNIFTALGQDIADMVYGDRVKPQDVMTNLIDNSLNYLNAFGGSGVTQGMANMVSFAFPTVFRFMPELALNADYAGRPIYPENPYAPDTAEAYQSFENTPEIYRIVAQMANRAGGGNEVDEPIELLDWSPDSLEYMIGFMFSGFGRELQRLYTTATAETAPSEAPGVRDFTYDAQSNERFVVGEFHEIKNKTQFEKFRVGQMKKDAESGTERNLGTIDYDAMDPGIREGIDRVAELSKQIRQSRKSNLNADDVENLKQMRMDLMREVIRRRNALTRQ